MPRSHPADPFLSVNLRQPGRRAGAWCVFLDGRRGHTDTRVQLPVARGPARLEPEPVPVQPCDGRGSLRRPDVSPPSPLESPAACAQDGHWVQYVLVSRSRTPQPALALHLPTQALLSEARYLGRGKRLGGSHRGFALQRRRCRCLLSDGRPGEGSAARSLSERRARARNESESIVPPPARAGGRASRGARGQGCRPLTSRASELAIQIQRHMLAYDCMGMYAVRHAAAGPRYFWQPCAASSGPAQPTTSQRCAMCERGGTCTVTDREQRGLLRASRCLAMP